MLETVAIIGPARFGVPLTQALTAPMLGRLHARGVGFWPQLAACATVRLLHNAATTAFFIWVIAGGLDAYAGTYDAIGRRHRHRGGHRGRGRADRGQPARLGRLREHGAGAGLPARAARPGPTAMRGAHRGGRNRCGKRHDSSTTRRFDPRAITLSAAVAFALLLGSTEWAFLAAMAAWLAAAWLADPRRPRAAPSRRRLRRHPRRAAPSSSPSAAASASTPRCAARSAPRCSCSPPPGSARRPAPRASARCRGACSHRHRRALGRPRPSSVLDGIDSEGRLAEPPAR